MIDVNIPIICIQDYDFARIDELIEYVVGSKNVYEWNPATGKTNFKTKESNQFETLDVFLDCYLKEESIKPKPIYKYLILKDVQDYVNEQAGSVGSLDPVKTKIKTQLQLIAQRRLYDPSFNTTVIIVSTYIHLPQELEKYASYLDIPPLSDNDVDEIKQLINLHVEVNEYKNFNPEDIDKLMPSLKGLTRFEIDRMLDMAMSSNGTLTAEDQIMLSQHKKQMVKKSGLLELVDTPANLESIGGMNALKDYLQKKAKIINRLEEAKKMNVAVPKGVFIVGMPGCGKSLCAKATAALFDAPLLKMDMGRMMNKYVGESEGNLRRAIQIAEAAAPCVLWIDEIEKAFSGIGGNDIMTRMFGYFLSWMQDKTSSVYVIATANNADNLPPELKRKGRFDEIFCVNLPTDEERKAIFKVHLKKKGKGKLEPSRKLIKDTKGFNGADIEAVVNEAMEERFLNTIKKEKSVEEIDFMKSLEKIAKRTISISKSCEEQIKKMGDVFATSSFKDATTGEITKSGK
jgi:ATP-dependent 26S proteasome regulatory subunit